MERIIFRTIFQKEISPQLFSDFDRFQKVTQCWRKEECGWILKNISFTEQWGEKEYEILCHCLKNTIDTGGGVFGAFYDKKLKGFCSVESRLFGSQKQYLQLSSLHVSADVRGKGIGRHLFYLACNKARELSGRKLYISSHSARETQAFYRAVGCLEAEEYDPSLTEAEPCDCQLEYRLK